MEYKDVFLWGDPNFYSKFGFVPSYKFNIFHKDFQEQKVDFIMVYQLCENALEGKKGMIDIY
jgi:predicted N-acetyltransferase YhbS